MDGLDLYCEKYLKIRFKSSLLNRIREMESLSGETLLLEMESFLAATSEDADDFACYHRNLGDRAIETCFQNFRAAEADQEKLQALTPLIVDSQAFAIGALRSLTALARLIDPMNWGTLNWRILACAGFPSMTELKNTRIHHSQERMKSAFALVPERQLMGYLAFMRDQIRPELPSVPHVVGALYCLSLELWPLSIPIEKPGSLLALLPNADFSANHR